MAKRIWNTVVEFRLDLFCEMRMKIRILGDTPTDIERSRDGRREA